MKQALEKLEKEEGGRQLTLLDIIKMKDQLLLTLTIGQILEISDFLVFINVELIQLGK